mgnify:CR=1 FL=1
MPAGCDSLVEPQDAAVGQTLYGSVGGAAGVMLLALQTLVYGAVFWAILAVSAFDKFAAISGTSYCSARAMNGR